MNSKTEMKYFSAVTYDGSTYHFGITPNGEISCAEFGITYPASIIELKPNFVLRSADWRSVYSLDDHLRNRYLKKKDGRSLISKWDIPEDVFEYLINERKVLYSTQMAMLYGFDVDYAYDKNHNKRAFKSSRHNPEVKARILAPQKLGKFN